jgi:hypothetical protein
MPVGPSSWSITAETARWLDCLKLGEIEVDNRLQRLGCDLIMLATGYDGQAEAARRIPGDEVGDRMGPLAVSTKKVSCGACGDRPGSPGFGSLPADWRSEYINRLPASAWPARLALQLRLL